MVRELREVAKPLFEPAFVDTLAQAMPPAFGSELRSMVTEYREALIASEAGNRGEQAAMGDGMTGERADSADAKRPQEGRRAARAERARQAIDDQVYDVRQVGREMARSFQNFVADKQQKGEELYALVEATPEQRAKIDAILRADGEGAALIPTDAQRRERFQKILGVLTPEQRRKVLSERGR
jgi:Spy/CpxP family protein refolding chaperone